ncbi:MAG: Lon-like protease helical domain-containing protein, partial [Planctomycetota bacterium]
MDELELKAEQLLAACDPSTLGFETTAGLPVLEGSIGQDRAVAAISFGLEMKTEGYNLFAAGATGTGRNFAVVTHAQEAAAERPTPDDWCYVYNFEDPRQPRALRLP